MLLWAAAVLPAAAQSIGTIDTVIGGNNGDGQTASNAILDPLGMEARGQHLYIADSSNHRVRRVDGITGIITTVAGNGQSGFTGDGGSALNATLSSPRDVTFDAAGNMYIAEQLNRRVRRVDLAGNIQTVAGNGSLFYQGDNIPATQTAIDPYGIDFDSANNLYIADFNNHRVRKVTPQGIITTVAGNGTSGYTGDKGPAAQATLASPSDVWVDANNNLYISNYATPVIRKVDPSGVITTVAGNGLRSFFGDNGPAVLAMMNQPYGILTDPTGNLFIVDSGNFRLRRVDASTQIINTIAGNGINTNSGDGGPASSASLFSPIGVALDTLGNLYVGSRDATGDAWSKNDRVRKISPAGTISFFTGISHNGDAGPASGAIVDPFGIRFGRGAFANELYITDRRNNQIRRVNGATGLITTVAGNGQSGFAGDGDLAINARLNGPRGVAADASGNIWIADSNNNRVRRIDTSGFIRTVAGNGTNGFNGDGSATAVMLSTPYAVDVDTSGNLYIADRFNNRIRKVTPGGTLTTIAGNGSIASTGNDGPASQAAVGSPTDVLVGPDGSIYFAEVLTHQVRKITPAGIMVRVAGTGTSGFGGDQGPALDARLNAPAVLAFDSAGNLFIGEQTNLRVRRVDAITGTITTVAGNGVAGSNGDGGIATAAQLLTPTGLAADSAGGLFVSQADSFSIRKVVLNAPPSTPTSTATNTRTPTLTPANTSTSTASRTPTRTPTLVPTSTFTSTPTSTRTPTNTPPPTNTSTATPTSTRTNTATPTFTPTASSSPTSTLTRTPTATFSQTPTPSVTLTWTSTPSRTPTRTTTSTPAHTTTRTPTRTPTTTSTPTATRTPTQTRTNTGTRTPTRTPTQVTPTATSAPATPTATRPPSTPTATRPPSTPTATRPPSTSTQLPSTATATRPASTPTPTPTRSATPSFTRTASLTPTGTTAATATLTAVGATRTPTWTNTATATAADTATRTATRTFTLTRTPTATTTFTRTPSTTPTRTATSSRTPTTAPTGVPTAVAPTSTRSATPTRSTTPTRSATRTPTVTTTFTFTRTRTPTFTRTGAPTGTAAGLATFTPTRTWTRAATATRTFTRSATPSRTRTPTITATFTRTPSLGQTPVSTSTRTHSRTPTPTRTVPQPPQTDTPTETATPTETPLPTSSPSATATHTPSPTASATATVPVDGEGAIAGQIRHLLNTNLVPAVDVALEVPTGAEVASTMTTAGGLYSFPSVGEQSWTIEPALIGELGDSIDEMDAALVLSVATGEQSLTPDQMLAADVTGNGSISAVDASLILQRVTGLIDTFPVAELCSSDWLFLPEPEGEPPFGGQTVTQPHLSEEHCVPGSITLNPLVGEITGRDFLAIAFGDVDGSWASARAGEGATDAPIQLGHPRPRGGSVQIPIEVSPAPFRGLYLEIEYDPATVTFRGLRRGPEARELLLVINDTEPGRIVVAAASAVDIETRQPLTLELATDIPRGYPDIRITASDIGPL